MRRRHQRSRHAPADLDITAFMNLMVILVPFLLITAVFSRMAVVELNLPDRGTVSQAEEETLLQVTVREDALQLGDSRGVVETSLQKNEAGYDYAALAQWVQEKKAENPEETEAVVLLEPQIVYDVLIQVMDRLRYVPAPQAGVEPEPLFPAVSLGPAPAVSQ